MTLGTVYVTVGTTRFTELIEKVTSDDILRVLRSRGCCTLILQVGNGKFVNTERIYDKHQIVVEQYKFKIDVPRPELTAADLIIGHAGAGTCLDILKSGRPGLVVVNEALMNNHQTELAQRLAIENYLYYCYLKDLRTNLKTLNFENLQPYRENKEGMQEFINHLNMLMNT